ncbi:DUF177 domain-containing protein [Austwickia sp. TVS 96-490-7B]|uniref:YceD family protein n=1 Tax=Austwickia sp. TVS 96-490-7B TaxID=2830843 RepID=UPI001C57DCF4|nr:YceD family protein [Austwickia sp. TVS 96-490-7B]
MTSPDPRSPLVFDTRVLGRRAGSMEIFDVDAQLSMEMGTDVIAVPEGDVIHVDLRLESVLEGVLASGTVDAVAEGACGRCLEPVSLPVQAEFLELFAYADRAAHHQQLGDDETDQCVLEGSLLDLEPVLRDAVVLALPFQPTCRPDCPGLCSECGQSLTADPDHGHDIIDPRWASLQSLAAGEGSDTSSPHIAQEKRN